jgi:hypothetical protein
MMNPTLHQELLQYINEGRSKPALMAAKFCLLAELDPDSYHELFAYASEILEVLSEIDDPEMSFTDVYALLSNTNSNNGYFASIKLSLCLYKLRTGIIDDEELEDQITKTLDCDSVKELICKAVSSLYCERYGDAYEFLSAAFEKDVYVARSLLNCFTKPHLSSFRADLSEAREKNLIPCSCNTSGQNHGFRSGLIHAVKATYGASCENLAETSFITEMITYNSSNGNSPNAKNNQHTFSFQLCKLHRLITELDDVIRLVEMADSDRTAITKLYLDAGRYDLAAKYMEINSNLINQNEVKNVAMEIRRPSSQNEDVENSEVLPRVINV